VAVLFTIVEYTIVAAPKNLTPPPALPLDVSFPVTVEFTIVNVASGPADWKMPPPSPSVELSLIVEFLTVNELPTLMPPPAHAAELPTMLELRTVIGALARIPPP
jgi:hypothetical protein